MEGKIEINIAKVEIKQEIEIKEEPIFGEPEEEVEIEEGSLKQMKEEVVWKEEPLNQMEEDHFIDGSETSFSSLDYKLVLSNPDLIKVKSPTEPKTFFRKLFSPTSQKTWLVQRKVSTTNTVVGVDKLFVLLSPLNIARRTDAFHHKRIAENNEDKFQKNFGDLKTSLERNINSKRNYTEKNGKLTQNKKQSSVEKPFGCNICNKAFRHKKHFNQHKLTHSDEKLFVCKICNKSFKRKWNLNMHKLIHSGAKPFSCNICNNTFNQKSSLNVHKLIHSDEKPFVCNTCNNVFKHKNDLKRHKLIHSGEKPFACPICSKTFNWISNLNSHKLIHSDEKLFECDLCKRTFKHKRSLKRHVLMHLK